MQKPNVLFISSWYPSKEHETLGNFAQRHAESINEFVNLNVLYVTSSERITRDFEIENGIINGVNTTIVYYKKINSTFPVISQYLKFKKSTKAFLKGLDYIEKEFGIKTFDITHCNVTFPAGLFAYNLLKTRNIPYVITEHWTLFLPYKNDFEKLNYITKYMMRKIVKSAEYILPVSEHLGNSMQKLGLKGKYKVIPNVADTNLFQLKHKRDNNLIKILHVSTLIQEHKNINGILNVLKELSLQRDDFQLTIVSDGEVDLAKKHQKKIGLDDKFVHYEGTKTPEEIAEFYRNSDFFLLFSNYENLPCVMVESMSCGIPFVSSNVGGISEYVNKSNGILVEPRDEKALLEAIISTMNSLESFDNESIREVAISNFDNKKVGEEFLKVYLKSIKN